MTSVLTVWLFSSLGFGVGAVFGAWWATRPPMDEDETTHAIGLAWQALCRDAENQGRSGHYVPLEDLNSVCKEIERATNDARVLAPDPHTISTLGERIRASIQRRFAARIVRSIRAARGSGGEWDSALGVAARIVAETARTQ